MRCSCFRGLLMWMHIYAVMASSKCNKPIRPQAVYQGRHVASQAGINSAVELVRKTDTSNPWCYSKSLSDTSLTDFIQADLGGHFYVENLVNDYVGGPAEPYQLAYSRKTAEGHFRNYYLYPTVINKVNNPLQRISRVASSLRFYFTETTSESLNEKCLTNFIISGCAYSSGLMEYDVPESSFMESGTYNDSDYDGVRRQGRLSGGLGVLARRGDISETGVAWCRRTTGRDFVDILLKFDTARNFSDFKIHVANRRPSPKVLLFAKVDLTFGFSEDFSVAPHSISQMVRADPVTNFARKIGTTVSQCSQCIGRFVRARLYFSAQEGDACFIVYYLVITSVIINAAENLLVSKMITTTTSSSTTSGNVVVILRNTPSNPSGLFRHKSVIVVLLVAASLLLLAFVTVIAVVVCIRRKRRKERWLGKEELMRRYNGHNNNYNSSNNNSHHKINNNSNGGIGDDAAGRHKCYTVDPNDPSFRFLHQTTPDDGSVVGPADGHSYASIPNYAAGDTRQCRPLSGEFQDASGPYDYVSLSRPSVVTPQYADGGGGGGGGNGEDEFYVPYGGYSVCGGGMQITPNPMHNLLDAYYARASTSRRTSGAYDQLPPAARNITLGGAHPTMSFATQQLRSPMPKSHSSCSLPSGQAMAQRRLPNQRVPNSATDCGERPAAATSIQPSGENSDDTCTNYTQPMRELAAYLPQINLNHLQLCQTLGTGHFGNVVLARLMGADSPDSTSSCSRMCIVKFLNPAASYQIKRHFWREMSLHTRFTHANLSAVIGVIGSDDNAGDGDIDRDGGESIGVPTLQGVAFDYLLHGNMNVLLRKLHCQRVARPDTNEVEALSSGCLVYLASQVAAGMAHLASLHVLHRDLAARNCLVGDAFHVVISDVGMCDVRFAEHYHQVADGVVLPVRWMAPESIVMSQFSQKSDVWSFAVLLWELFTFCQFLPFPNFSNDQVVYNARNLHTASGSSSILPCPQFLPREVHDLMRQCWTAENTSRPSFSEIHLFLQRKNHGFSPDADILCLTNTLTTQT